MFDSLLLADAADLLEQARHRSCVLCTAESCTGGLIAALLTEIPGSSDVFLGGHVVYANEAKRRFLGVPHSLLSEYGAVSEPVARAMAQGAAESFAHIAEQRNVLAIAVTGIAGPDGGTPDKPVGTVHICAATHPGGAGAHHCFRFSGNRREIRLTSVREAVAMMREAISYTISRSMKH